LRGRAGDIWAVTPCSCDHVRLWLACDRTPKPSYRALQLLHWAGHELLQTSPSFLHFDTVSAFAATGNDSSTLASIFLVNWDVMKNASHVVEETVEVILSGLPAHRPLEAVIYRIDEGHTNAFPTWVKQGQPPYLTNEQVKELNAASELVAEPFGLARIADEPASGARPRFGFALELPPFSVANVIIRESQPETIKRPQR
jgi:hypothetical protein